MGFDKTKALNAAEKSLAQGKIANAIQEYRKIVEHDARDLAALNTLGDLYVRTGKPAEAIECFVRVADHYREQGFALKAVAVYKKISRLNPEIEGVAQNLARLYEQQGLYVEARAQYQTIADAAFRSGRAAAGLEVLRRIADLDHKNSDIRLRLAEGYAREGMDGEAAHAYVEAGNLLLARNSAREALDAYKLAQELQPKDRPALEGLVAASCQVGAAGEAAALLERVLADIPDDLELRAMLARTYVAAEDAPAAERATEALVRAEASNYPLCFDVARLYVKRGAADDAVRVLNGATDAALSGKQAAALLEALGEALAQEPAHVEALKLLARVHGWRRDDDQMRDALERLAEAARQHDDVKEERRALEHLVRLVPFDQSYHERLAALRSANAPATEDEERQIFRHAPVEESPPLDALSPDAPPLDAPLLTPPVFDLPAVSDAEFDPTAFDTSAFDPTAFDASAFAAPNANEAATVGDAPPLNAQPFGASASGFALDHEAFATPDYAAVAEASAPAVSDPFAPGVAEFEWNSVAASEEAARVDPSASFADLNADSGGGYPAEASSPRVSGSAFEPTAFGPTGFGQSQEAAQEAELADPFAATAPPNGSGRADALLRQELESVDFYLAQGYADIASDTLDLLERQFGQSSEIEARRRRLRGAAASHETADVFGAPPAGDSKSSSHTSFAPSVPDAVGGLRADESAFANFAEAPGPVAPLLAARADAPPSHSKDLPPLSARGGARPAADPKIADLFGEFLDAEEPAESHDEDFETHFNLGLAYKEMHLWGEAVEQFQRAADVTSPGDGTSRYLQCCNMLGHCLTEQGLPRAAAVWFKKALALPGLNEDENQALRYDLAAAYEAMGDIDRAVDTLTEVYALNVTYRGVAEKLRELQSRKVGVNEG